MSYLMAQLSFKVDCGKNGKDAIRLFKERIAGSAAAQINYSLILIGCNGSTGLESLKVIQ